MNDEKLINLWKQSETTIGDVDMEAIKLKSVKFEKTIKWRNLREYAAAIFVMVMFIRSGLETESTVRMIANFEIALSALVICFFLYFKGKSEKVSDLAADSQKYLRAHKEALKKQIKLLGSVRYWYVFPLMAGMLVLNIESWMSSGNIYVGLGSVIFSIALGIGIIYLNEYYGVRKLQEELDSLESK
ncbi:MAG: hypothetical protein KC493_01660 [Bacteriovoracaceae bacterium]|nr:hypothetical protein [Bacteriovoracaceae bacterium]